MSESDNEIFDVLRNGGSIAGSSYGIKSTSSHTISIPPHSIKAERSLIGSMLNCEKALAIGLDLIVETELYNLQHQQFFRVMRDLFQAGTAVNAVTVANELLKRRIVTESSDADILLMEYLEFGIPQHAASYAQVIRDKACRRSVLVAWKHTLSDLDDESKSLDDLLSRAASTIQTASENLSRFTKPKFSVMTSGELDAADLNTEYLVDGILAADQPCIVAAVKKCLKTNIAIDLTLSLASGSKFLNRFYTPRAVRVALMSGESGDATIQETARRIARSKPWINLSDYSNAIWSFELPMIGRLETKRDLIRFIRDHALEVLIVDPAYLCLDLGDDAGNLFKVGPKLIVLTEVMRETGCTIIIVHHNKKSTNAPFRCPELDDIAWSGFQEWARQWILMNRRETYNAENAGSHKLWLNVGGSAGHSGLWALDIEEGDYNDRGGRRWDVSIQGASQAIAETIENRDEAKASLETEKTRAKIEADSKLLLEAYRDFPNGDTLTAVRDSIAMSGKRSAPANMKLLKDGLIEHFMVKKAGQPRDAYRLKSSSGTSGTNTGLTGTDRDCPACPGPTKHRD